jgi:nucleotide-binding universal stress UspA family protein
MPTILTCTDGSIYARSVYDHTAWAAQRLDAGVHVLHILEPHRDVAAMADLSGAIGVDAQAKLTEELVALEEAKARVANTHARAILADATQHLTAAGIARVNVEATHGELIDSIERFEAGADLIVIGKRGEHADFGKRHLGGNLQRVIRAAHHPVLVASRAFGPIERALIAFDGGPSAKAAVAFAASSRLLRGLQFHLLHAGSETPAIQSSLEAAREQLATAGQQVQAEIRPGEPDKVIAEAVKREGINLLVMGAYGHSRIREFILGSTTTTMVRTCLVPVLMFR